MKITMKWLEEKNACQVGKDWFAKQRTREGSAVVRKLMKEDNFQHANWLIVRLMDRPQYLSYAIFAAEQVIGKFEKKYPNDGRPRMAIESAKAVLANDTPENRNSAYDAAAAYAAYAAAAAAYAAAYAAYAAAYSADAAYAYAADAYAADAYAADAAAYAAYAADAAASADASADAAADAYARKEMRERIINYGLELLEVRK